MRCVAIIALRNGMDYLPHCIEHLAGNGIEIAILDQMSTDGSYEWCQKFLGNEICFLDRYSYPGYFSLSDQLKHKQRVIDSLDPDWVIHQDIDECLEPSTEGKSLFSAIVDESRSGYDVINFDEFVFLPMGFSSHNFYESPYYYFFRIRYPWLMRAWRNRIGLRIDQGGHALQGQYRLSPNDFIMRHYIFTSQEHARKKYQERVFSQDELTRGWHKSRVLHSHVNMDFPEKKQLQRLTIHTSRQFARDSEHSTHYWSWD